MRGIFIRWRHNFFCKVQTVLLFTIIKPTFEPNQFFPVVVSRAFCPRTTYKKYIFSKNYVRRYLKFSRSWDLQLHSIWYRKGILFEYEKVYDDSCKECIFGMLPPPPLFWAQPFLFNRIFFSIANYFRYVVDTPVYSPAVLKWIEPAQKLT